MLSDELMAQIKAEVLTELTSSVELAVEASLESVIAKTLADKKGVLDDIIHHAAVQEGIFNKIRNLVALEISNRLRCAIYDGSEVQRIFDSVFPEELDKAMKDRVRWKLGDMVDEAVRERLKKLINS